MEKESKAAAGKSPAALAGSELWEGPAGDFVARAPIYGDILARLGARDGVHGDPCDWPDTLPVWRVQGSSPIVAMIRATDPRRAAAIFAHRYGSRPDYVGRRAERRGWVLLFLLILLTTFGGLYGAWDRQPMGEGRTERQQEVERG